MMTTRTLLYVARPFCLCVAATLATNGVAFGQEQGIGQPPERLRSTTPPNDSVTAPSGQPNSAKTSSDKPVPLNKQGTVLIDAKNKQLIIESQVVLRQGMLEMLLCKRHTKEHESILAFEGQAYILHAGLMALGVEPGTPVQFDPEFRAPSGPKLKIELVWNDKQGKEQRVDAREWVRHSIHRYFGEPLEERPAGLVLPKDSDLRYDEINKQLSWYGPMTKEQRDEFLALSKDEAYRAAIEAFYKRGQSRPMQADWVFAGSAFAQDETSGRKIYLAESGDVICVANFPSATIDVAKRSSAEGQESLLFEAWTERVPPIGTPVRVVITPVTKESTPKADAQSPPTRQDAKETSRQDSPSTNP